MAAIKPLDKIISNWSTGTAGRQDKYRDGVSAPKRPWKAATAAAATNWKDGVTKAVAANSFAKGVGRSSDEKWQTKSATLGADRWAPGVQAAETDFGDGFAPYAAAIAQANLPQRFARRDPRNLDRVKAINDALIARKASLTQ